MTQSGFMSSLKYLLAGAFLLCASQAQALEVTCPANISTKAVSNDIWKRAEEGPAPKASKRFGGLTVFEGAPEGLASLVPDSDDGHVAMWKLDGIEITIACLYIGTKWTFTSRPIGNTTSCSATYANDSAGKTISRTLVCK